MKHLLFNNQQNALFTTAVLMSITSSKKYNSLSEQCVHVHTYIFPKQTKTNDFSNRKRTKNADN